MSNIFLNYPRIFRDFRSRQDKRDEGGQKWRSGEVEEGRSNWVGRWRAFFRYELFVFWLTNRVGTV